MPGFLLPAGAMNKTSAAIKAADALGRSLAQGMDKIPGGLAEGKSPLEFDPEQLAEGVKVEREHTAMRDIAMEIAADHLVEDKDYYKKLQKMESAKEAGVVFAGLFKQAYSALAALEHAPTVLAKPTGIIAGTRASHLMRPPTRLAADTFGGGSALSRTPGGSPIRLAPLTPTSRPARMNAQARRTLAAAQPSTTSTMPGLQYSYKQGSVRMAHLLSPEEFVKEALSPAFIQAAKASSLPKRLGAAASPMAFAKNTERTLGRLQHAADIRPGAFAEGMKPVLESASGVNRAAQSAVEALPTKSSLFQRAKGTLTGRLAKSTPDVSKVAPNWRSELAAKNKWQAPITPATSVTPAAAPGKLKKGPGWGTAAAVAGTGAALYGASKLIPAASREMSAQATQPYVPGGGWAPVQGGFQPQT